MSAKILFCVSGSISAFKAAGVVSDLVKQGHEVQVVFSPTASQFVGKMTFEGLTNRKVLDDLFESGEAMAHIDYARWADLFVLCPASAQKLSQLANGSAGDLISSLFLAKKPEVPAMIFPAMNTVMWNHPFVQKNVELISTLPYTRIIQPSSGNLACGETGEGRLPEQEDILAEIKDTLSGKHQRKGKILITGGGTSESIDAVRSITNTSSGETACLLSDHLSSQGFEVELLLSQTARFHSNSAMVTYFTSHGDLSEKLKEKLQSETYSGLVHLAAVSDFSPEIQSGKISSDLEKITLELKRTPKIISHLREWSRNKELKIVGFKLTVDQTQAGQKRIANDLLKKNQLSAVVANDLRDKTQSSHKGLLIRSDDEVIEFKNKSQMFQQIQTVLEESQ